MTLRERNEEVIATVFVPSSAGKKLARKIEQYQNEDTNPRAQADKPPSPPRPKHEDLVAHINSVTHSLVESLYTGARTEYPQPAEKVWWEIWLRPNARKDLDQNLDSAGLVVGVGELVFPERVVRLVYGDTEAIGRLFVNSTALAEFRRSQDSPGVFLRLKNRDQVDWANDAAGRIVLPATDSVSVTLLDTGVNRVHPMLMPLIGAADVRRFDENWAEGDTRGHGTAMAGTALFGDLVPVLLDSSAINAEHLLESIKILPDGQSENDRQLYGAITKDAVAQAVFGAPSRRRAICLAITSNHQTGKGEPSAWSAAVDQICHGNGDPQLMLVAAGNIRNLQPGDYPGRNDVEPVESPGQAWNALTVGAFTRKVDLIDNDYRGWTVVAPLGDLCPASRTSVMWKSQWPIKPEIVMEGGNFATDGQLMAQPEDLGLLTTHYDPASRQFEITGETSAATALASGLAARLTAKLPNRWPETIRALMVHSARWTRAMEDRRASATSEIERRAFLRRYGYGVPDFDRAIFSASNDLTLVFEDTIQPFEKSGGSVKTKHMKLYQLPWPSLLEDLGSTGVDLRVTLSYFVEPNPGERGWLHKHSYASHGFRFEIRRPTESPRAFLSRINKQSQGEDGIDDFRTKAPPDQGWVLGRIRDVGSIHSDCWRGTATDLLSRDVLAVYPRRGWWKESPSYRRHDSECRYALIVSLTVPADVDIYTSIASGIKIETGINL